jgi:hypothetical protein
MAPEIDAVSMLAGLLAGVVLGIFSCWLATNNKPEPEKNTVVPVRRTMKLEEPPALWARESIIPQGIDKTMEKRDPNEDVSFLEITYWIKVSFTNMEGDGYVLLDDWNS